MTPTELPTSLIASSTERVPRHETRRTSRRLGALFFCAALHHPGRAQTGRSVAFAETSASTGALAEPTAESSAEAPIGSGPELRETRVRQGGVG
jgi:hypothetical protein